MAARVQKMFETGELHSRIASLLPKNTIQYTSEVKCSSLAIGKPSLQLKTTFGERMNVGKNVQTDVYFSQLTNSWNTTKPNNIPT